MRTPRHPLARRSGLLTLVLALALVGSTMPLPLAGAQSVNTAYTVLQMFESHEPVTGPVTVRTQVTLGPEVRSSNQGVWLAGFASEPSGVPSVLGVSLAQVGSGWLGPMWGVQLYTEDELFPRRLAAQQGTIFLAGKSYVPLQTAPLPWNREYEVTLGYDPITGVASVTVYDLTAESMVLARNLQLEPYDGALYPVAGVGAMGEPTSDPIAQLTSFETEASVLPTRVLWWVMQRAQANIPFTSSAQLDRRHETVISASLPWDQTPGTLQVSLVDADGRLARSVPVGDAEYTPLIISDLAGGPHTAVMEYVYEGQTWLLDERPVTLGAVEVALMDTHVTQADGAAQVTGTLRVVTDGPLEQLTVGLTGQLYRHTFAWDSDGRSGKTQKVPVGDAFILGMEGVQPNGATQMQLSGSVTLPAVQPGEGYELVLEPFGLPDLYVMPTEPTSVWLVDPEYDVPWLGFFEHEQGELVEWVPGVSVLTLRAQLPAGPIRMYLVAIDVTRPELALDALVGAQPTSEAARWPRDQVGTMVQRSGALMGINSAFFDIRNTQLPSGIVMQSGEILKTGTTNAVAFEADGTPYIGSWMWLGSVRVPGGGSSRTLAGINELDMSSGIGLYRWPIIRTPGTILPGSVELVVTELVEEDDLTPDSRDRILRGVVTEVREGQPGIEPQPGTVVLAGMGLNGAWLKQHFAVGDAIEVVHRLVGQVDGPGLDDWRDMYAAVSGGVVLVRNGALGDSQVQTNSDRHPRTALGISEDRTTLYWLLVDGRSTASVGMMYLDMARYFQYIDAHYAINLDGGGSSTLAARVLGENRVTILNVTSDGSQRFVPDGIGLFYEAE